MATRIGNLLVKLGFDTTGLDTGAARSKKKIGNYNRYAKKQSTSISGHFTKMAGAIGASFAIGAVLQDAAKTIMQFEQSVANLASITGKSIEQMDGLVDSAKEIGAVSSFSASEVVALQTELAKLGFSEDEIIAGAKSVGDFSVALGTDAASAAEFAGSTLRGFGIDATDATRVLDTLALATTKSALDFNKLQTGLSIVAPVAKGAGVSLERTTAILGTLADRGLDASTAGSSLRNIFLDLAKSGLTMEQALEKINSSQDKLNTANELFGKRGATTALILAENQESVSSLEGAISNANGALEEMTDKRLDTLEGQLKLTKSAWEGFILSIDSGDGFFSKAGKNIAQFGTDVLSVLTAFNDGGASAALSEYIDQANRIEVADIREKREGQIGTSAARGTAIRTFADETKLLELTLEGLQSTLLKSTEGTKEYNQTVEDIAGVKAKLTARTKAYNGIIDDTGDKLKKIAPEYQTLTDKLSANEQELSKVIDKYVQGGSVNDQLLQQASQLVTEQERLNKEIETTATLRQKLTEGDRATIIAPAQIGGIALPDRIDSQAASTPGASLGSTGIVDVSTTPDVSEFQNYLTDNASSIGSTLSDDFINSFTAARDELAALKDELQEYQAILSDPAATDAQVAAAKANITAIESQISAKQREASIFTQLTQTIIGTTADLVNAYLQQALAAQIASNSSLGLPGLIAASIGVGIITSLFKSSVAGATAFEQGGIIPMANGGVLSGPSHAAGGIAAQVAAGGPSVELEGGEVVINKRSSKIFRSELSRINSYAGHGTAFASGGVIPGGGSSAAVDNMRTALGYDKRGGQVGVTVDVQIGSRISGNDLYQSVEQVKTQRMRGRV